MRGAGLTSVYAHPETAGIALMVSVGDMRVPGGGTYIFTMAPTVAWETVGVSDGHEKQG